MSARHGALAGLVLVFLGSCATRSTGRLSEKTKSNESRPDIPDKRCGFPANPARIDLPEDNRRLKILATRGVAEEREPAPERIFAILEDHFKQKFSEKEVGSGFKHNAVKLIKTIAQRLNCPNTDALAYEVGSGRLQDFRIYTDEPTVPSGSTAPRQLGYQIINTALRAKKGDLKAIQDEAPETHAMIEKLDHVMALVPAIHGVVFGVHSSRKRYSSP